MTYLHVFDMDGTLLRSTASVELARRTGHSGELHDLELASAAGELSNIEFHRRTHGFWQDLTDDTVDDVFAHAPWVRGITSVVADIHNRGETAIVISMSPLFFVERLLRWGFAAAFASVNPIGSEFDESLVLENEDKIRIVDRFRRTHDFAAHRVVAYGDSYTDVPLFSSGIRSVAVNASPQVEELATSRYRGDDLAGAYALGRSLLEPDSDEIVGRV